MAKPTKEQIKAIADRAEGLRPAKHAGGRPSSYQATFAKQAEKLCLLGATNADLADFFGVSIRTIERWASEHDEFCRALKNGKRQADERVERSLYQRAVGYSFDSEKVFQYQGEVVRAKTREHCPPDTTAMIFWLKNRRPADWRDKTEVHHTHTVENMSDNDLERIASAGREGAAETPVDPSQLN
jgi:hypothetical protein